MPTIYIDNANKFSNKHSPKREFDIDQFLQNTPEKT